MKTAFSLMTAVIFFGVFFIGCAKDKSLEQWQREKQAQDIAKIQSVSGVYSGDLGSTGSKFSLELKPGTLLISNANAQTTMQQATLQGRATVIGEETATASFDQGFIDRDTNEVHIEIKLKDVTELVTTLDITGVIDGKTFNGEIVNRSYPETAQKLRLTLGDTATVNTQIRSSRSAEAMQSKIFLYNGTVFDSYTHANRKAQLSLVLPTLTTEELFFQTFSPVQIVHASFILIGGENLKVGASFRSAQWNRTTGTISSREIAQAGAEMKDRILNCKALTAAAGWHCKYILGDEGVRFEGVFQ